MYHTIILCVWTSKYYNYKLYKECPKICTCKTKKLKSSSVSSLQTITKSSIKFHTKKRRKKKWADLKILFPFKLKIKIKIRHTIFLLVNLSIFKFLWKDIDINMTKIIITWQLNGFDAKSIEYSLRFASQFSLGLYYWPLRHIYFGMDLMQYS